MNPTRWCLAALGLATTIAMNGCNYCGAKEQRAVNLWSGVDSLTVIRDGVTRRIGIISRLTEPYVSPSAFDFVFTTIEGSASGEGIALSVSGDDPVSGELVALTLALPVGLRPGDEYPLGRTFGIEPGVTFDARAWGPFDLEQSNRAEASFTVSKYSFPPPLYTTNFRAVASTGTVRVMRHSGGSLELLLNLTFTDYLGKTTTVTGRLQGSTERSTLACT